MRILNIQFDLVKHHFLDSAVHLAYLRNVLHRDVLELCELALAYHLDQ